VAGGRRGLVRRHDIAEEVAGLAQQGICAPGVTKHAGWAYSMMARSGWRAPGTARLMREAGRDLGFYQGFSAVSGALDSIGQAAAAAGLAVLAGTITGTTAARAAASVSAHATATAQPGPRFDPCPCDNPICRPAC
jgi:hypothetical protein